MIHYAPLRLEYLEEMMGEEKKHQFNHQSTQNIENGWKIYHDDCCIIL